MNATSSRMQRQATSAQLANRLEAIVGSVDGDETAVSRLVQDLRRQEDLGSWSRVDLTLLPRPSTGTSKRWSANLVALRNALVFLPVVVTWIAIARASSAFNALVDSGEDTSRGFLYLWQSGMNGTLAPFHRLSVVAFIDVLLIVLIILLSLVADVFRHSAERRQDERQHALDDEWDDLMVMVSHHLADEAFDMPERFRENLAKTASGLSAAAKETQEASERLRESSQSAKAAIDAQVRLVTGDLERIVSTSTTMLGELAALAQQQGASAAILTQGQDEILNLLRSLDGSMAAAAPALARAATEAERVLSGGAAAFGAAAVVLSEATGANGESYRALAAAVSNLSTALQQVDDLVASIGVLRGEFVPMIDLLGRDVALLDQVVERQQEAVDSSASLGEALKRVAALVEIGTARLRDDLDTIHDRLGDLVATDQASS